MQLIACLGNGWSLKIIKHWNSPAASLRKSEDCFFVFLHTYLCKALFRLSQLPRWSAMSWRFSRCLRPRCNDRGATTPLPPGCHPRVCWAENADKAPLSTRSTIETEGKVSELSSCSGPQNPSLRLHFLVLPSPLKYLLYATARPRKSTKSPWMCTTFLSHRIKSHF